MLKHEYICSNCNQRVFVGRKPESLGRTVRTLCPNCITKTYVKVPDKLPKLEGLRKGGSVNSITKGEPLKYYRTTVKTKKAPVKEMLDKVGNSLRQKFDIRDAKLLNMHKQKDEVIFVYEIGI